MIDDPDVGDDSTGDKAMLRPGQRGRAARGFGGRWGGGAPGRRLYRARRGRVAVWIATDVVGQL